MLSRFTFTLKVRALLVAGVHGLVIVLIVWLIDIPIAQQPPQQTPIIVSLEAQQPLDSEAENTEHNIEQDNEKSVDHARTTQIEEAISPADIAIVTQPAQQNKVVEKKESPIAKPIEQAAPKSASPKTAKKSESSAQQSSGKQTLTIPSTSAGTTDTASSPSGTSATDQDQTLTSARFDADYLKNPAPEYPTYSKRMKEQGTVLILVQVSAQGHPEKIQLQQSSGFDSLDEAALQAVRQWQFVPARRGQTPIAASVIVPIQFKR